MHLQRCVYKIKSIFLRNMLFCAKVYISRRHETVFFSRKITQLFYHSSSGNCLGNHLIFFSVFSFFLFSQGEKYTVLSSLGEGGYAKVYSAFGQDKKVALVMILFNQNVLKVQLKLVQNTQEIPKLPWKF